MHSRYERRVVDAAVAGRRVVIGLRVRRLFCDDPACQARTFTEQVPPPPHRQGDPDHDTVCAGIRAHITALQQNLRQRVG